MMDDILKGKTVLLVDDTAVSRVLGADILTTNEMKVLEADSGEQALQQAAKHAIDAFLLDIRLPDMNGIELCRALRAIPATATLPSSSSPPWISAKSCNGRSKPAPMISSRSRCTPWC